MVPVILKLVLLVELIEVFLLNTTLPAILKSPV